MKGHPIHRSWNRTGCVVATLAVALAMMGVSCANAKRIHVFNPTRGSAESTFELTPESAYYAADDSGKTRLVIECPLPGATGGRVFCTIYVRMPTDAGSFNADEQDGSGGFLIQNVGRLAGLVPIHRGDVQIGREKDHRSDGWMDLVGEDGTTIRGTFTAVESVFRVSRFEYEHSADLAALQNNSANQATTGDS